ncbi:PIR Superfamily Protein [Plasmodium ovale curtisi]|uniref:PIR Superfamily Protein n=1 Tax=Plasmodium ovale curtisi TaxID=864141 RepID=A0A1A8X541_PLAOA|nr:PIR Superfamily Protein [Plasmodium ovale curtisi]
MATGISVDELPSKKFNNIWNEGICYSEVNNIITDKKDLVDAFRWVENVKKKFSNNLKQQKGIIDDNTLEKRCRDLYYLIYGILYQLKNLKDYNTIYTGINGAIKNHINSAFINASFTDKGYANCLVVANEEDDYEHATIKNKKYIDDLCEDAIYVEKNINQINSSHECSKIKLYLGDEFNTHNNTYNLNKEFYAKILGYYEKDNFDSFKDIIAKIKCTTSDDFQVRANLDGLESRLDFLPFHIIIVPILSLLGFLLIFFFLYQATPLRSWFDRKIRKKIIFANNENDEVSHKILEEPCEYPKTNSYNDEYHVLYNTVADN